MTELNLAQRWPRHLTRSVGARAAGMEHIGWHGMMAPKRTPAAIVNRLNRASKMRCVCPTSKRG
jgi:hypothetical protein